MLTAIETRGVRSPLAFESFDDLAWKAEASHASLMIAYNAVTFIWSATGDSLLLHDCAPLTSPMLRLSRS